MILGQRIREEREKRNWTQNDLAELLNVSRQSVSKWEIGTAYPDIDRLIQISDLFEVSLDSLIRGDDKFQKKIKVENPKVGMTFWDFLNHRWWIIFIVAWCLAWLIPVIIHAFK
ncbi:helix-turn-helix domain-containing protein [Fructilactobacillus carniphilus]|uniref:Helix-turn-helix domain-containing protein n=1 Tax=Fructilactobacillus carniphilus TaxID=2940297 RepID=A0ABY5BUT5_9LACO|nr:helix-turn-helix transcriptional regulator [Fructilactobacillus carniphilus]USS90261.1 helix-turn-helix domain-containing protein [Fructilactobacillus carniphilus]